MSVRPKECIYILALLFINCVVFFCQRKTIFFFVRSLQVRVCVWLHNKSLPHSNAIYKWMSMHSVYGCVSFLHCFKNGKPNENVCIWSLGWIKGGKKTISLFLSLTSIALFLIMTSGDNLQLCVYVLSSYQLNNSSL